MLRGAIEQIRRFTPTWLGGYRQNVAGITMTRVPSIAPSAVLGRLSEALIGKDAVCELVVRQHELLQGIPARDRPDLQKWRRLFRRVCRLIERSDPGDSPVMMKYRVNGVDLKAEIREEGTIVITRLCE